MLKLRSHVLAPVLTVLVFGGVLLSSAMNLWVTESNRVPTRFADGDFAGSADPADIRGSYSFADIEAGFGIPVADLAAVFGLLELEDPSTIRGSNLESIYGERPDGSEIGTDSLRLLAALYTGVPYVPEAGTRLPMEALPLLERRLAPADLALAERYLVDIDREGPVVDDALLLALEEEHELEEASQTAEEDRLVNGRTTFGDLLDWGLTREQIEATIGMPVGIRAQTLRDGLAANGLSFSTAKTAIEAMLAERETE